MATCGADGRAGTHVNAAGLGVREEGMERPLVCVSVCAMGASWVRHGCVMGGSYVSERAGRSPRPADPSCPYGKTAEALSSLVGGRKESGVRG
jgi:hypothetical protein